MTSVTVLPCADVDSAERVWTIVVGAGTGERFGGPKQYASLGDLRVIDHAVAAARSVSEGVVVVVPSGDVEREGGVAGGRTRSESVAAGLVEVPDDATIVCVHDAARPFASPTLFAAAIDAVRAGADGAIPGVAVADTIKVVEAGIVVSTLDRSSLVAVQTPQAFRADVLRRAHRSGDDATDDAALVESLGGRVVVVPGSHDNRKITHSDDLDWARRLLAARMSEPAR
jgi:2-C-methyl-D-erythritol 4-phosphate cytidylyltransferase